MAQLNRSPFILLLAATLFLGFQTGCKSIDSKNSQPSKKEEVKPKKTPTEKKAGAASKKKKKAFAARPFTIKYVQGEAKNGQATTTRVELTPLAGYKMNVEYPSALRVSANEKADTPPKDLAPKTEAVTKEKISFEIPVTPKVQGTISLAGSTDFSVCDERSCKVFRKEGLAWQVVSK